MTAGVYVIINTVTGEEYVGKSMDVEDRWKRHRSLLRTGGGNHIFRQAWRAYGESAFVFRILEECPGGRDLEAAEARHIAERQPAYNRSIPVAALARQVVTLTWPRDIAQAIDAAALARGLTKSELVVQVLRAWLAGQTEATETAEG